jgi:inner membrane protein
MDNVTHTLIGVLVGETLSRTVFVARDGSPDRRLRGLVLPMMAVGSNLADLDFLYSTITGSRLDYLLQHRGYTHTVIGAVVIAALLWIAAVGWARFRHYELTRATKTGLAFIALLAPILHIAMDFTNSYGVHPFWPWHNEWLYGDSVLIVEPLLWAAAAPLVFILQTRIARGIVALVLLSGVGLGYGSGMMPFVCASALTALIAVMLLIGRFARASHALLAGVVVWLSITTVFIAASHSAARNVERLFSQRFPQEKLLDHSLTPSPSDPLCWEVISIERHDDNFSLRRALLSLAPSWIPAAHCRTAGLAPNTTAPLARVHSANTNEIEWHGELTVSLAAFRKLAATDCRVAALLRFTRMPFIADREGKTIVGDLRYDREEKTGFAEIETPDDSADCPNHVPPWVEPRRDLLNSGDR